MALCSYKFRGLAANPVHLLNLFVSATHLFLNPAGWAHEKILFAGDISSAAGVYRGLLDNTTRWRQVRISL